MRLCNCVLHDAHIKVTPSCQDAQAAGDSEVETNKNQKNDCVCLLQDASAATSCTTIVFLCKRLMRAAMSWWVCCIAAVPEVECLRANRQLLCMCVSST